ncbi:vomeronasal type-1 receptor 1-like [Castor canadensis]|uniref:Vomeronasal type-1 receptor 1-like n=1 Tax=Castor canadensis TaxID=51338 RepID=A0A8B7TUX8_CASCN
MLVSELIFGIFLTSEIVLGFGGNTLLFMLCVYTILFQRHLKKPIDVIFTHLSLVNVLTIMFRLIPDTMSSFGGGHLFDDVGCKAVLYSYRVTRGLSICTTSLLTAFQAITISPRNSKWVWLKSKLSSCVFPSFLFFWIINMLIYIHIIETLTSSSNSTMVGSGYSHTYCTKSGHNQLSYVFLSVMVMHDVLFVTLMIWSSLYMVHLLHRHHRRAQHVHSTRLSSQPSPENKATHSILLLVSCFLFFYCSNNFITFYLFFRPGKTPTFERITGIVASYYPTICPFVLIKNMKIISGCNSPISEIKCIFC